MSSASSRRVGAVVAGVVVLLAVLAWLLLRGRAAAPTEFASAGAAPADPGLVGKRPIGAERETDVDARAPLRWRGAKATVAGRVHDTDGKPIGGASVCASITDDDMPVELRYEVPCTTSAPDGHYQLGGLAPVRMVISASAPSFIPGRHRPAGDQRWIEPAAGAAMKDIDIALRGGGVEIHGIVKDIAGGVVEGAQVTVGAGWWGQDGLSLARTDAEGAFSLWVAPGSCSVDASAEGYAPGSRQGAAPGYTFEVLLTPESVVAGRVVDAQTGAPVADADVRVSGSDWGGGNTRSDAEGRFRVGRLEPGRFTVSATTIDRYGVSNESRQVGLGQAIEDIEVRVFPSASIVGHVMVAGEAPTPCSVGSVSVHGRTSKHDGWASIQGDGRAELQGLPPDTYDVDVECDGYVPPEKVPEVVLAEAPIEGLLWEVTTGRALSGRVVDAEGNPVADAHIRATPTGGAARGKKTYAWGERTDASGAFTLEGLLPANYELHVQHTDYLSPEKPLAVAVPADHDVADVVLELAQGGTVRGRVVDAKGRPVPAASVAVVGARWDGASGHSRDDGSFELLHVRPGEHRVRAHAGWRDEMRAPGTSDDDVQGSLVTVRGGEVSEVELVVEEQFGSISGRVVDADGGPVDDAFVSFERESDSAAAVANRAKARVRWSSWSRAPVLTDHDGSFTLKDIPLGKHTLMAQRKGGGEGTIEHIETGTTGAVIRLSEGATISGKVTLAGGGVPARFTISAADEAQGVWRSEFFLRTAGAWQVAELPPGKYALSVQATEGFAETTVELKAGASTTDVVLELAPRVDVTGTVIDLETGAPVPGMMVSIGLAKGGFGLSFNDAGEQEHVSDESGRFTVRGAPAGKVRVMAIPRNFMGEGGRGYGWTRIRATIPADAGTFELPPLRVVMRRTEGRERGGDLGFTLAEIPPEDESEDHPLTVAVIRPGGPAAKTELKLGDAIVDVDGHDVTGDNRYLYGTLVAVAEGASVTLGLADGRKVTIVAGKPI